MSWDFKYLGEIVAHAVSPDADLEVAAIEAGAQDFEEGEEQKFPNKTDEPNPSSSLSSK